MNMDNPVLQKMQPVLQERYGVDIEQAKQMVTKEAIYIEAKKRAEELVGQTQTRIDALKKAGAYLLNNAQKLHLFNGRFCPQLECNTVRDSLFLVSVNRKVRCKIKPIRRNFYHLVRGV